MNLYEYEGRLLFKKYGIPVSDSGLALSPKEAKEVAERINPPYVVKAQVLVGGEVELVASDSPRHRKKWKKQRGEY